MSDNNIVEEYLQQTLGEDYGSVLAIADGLAYGDKNFQLPKFLDSEMNELTATLEENLTVKESRALDREVVFRKNNIANWFYYRQGTTQGEVLARQAFAQLETAKKGNSNHANDGLATLTKMFGGGTAANPCSGAGNGEDFSKPVTANEANTENVARILAIGLNNPYIPEGIVQRLKGLI